MLGSDFIDFIHKWQLPNYVSIEDFADKFNFLFTTMLLILSTVIISTKQYVFKPLSCHCPSLSTGANSYVDYAENFCWVEGTYAIKMSARIEHTDRFWVQQEDKLINYYQWVPFILGIQCIMFYLPRIVWLAAVTSKIGSDTQFLVTEAAKASHQTQGDKRKQVVRHLAGSVLHTQSVHQDYRIGAWADRRRRILRLCGVCLPSKRLGTSLVCWYLLVKILYAANAIGQLYLIGHVMSHGTDVNCTVFGWRVLTNMMSGKTWHATMVFPRITFCRIRLRNLESKDYVCQCALPVNMLNEKLYLLLYAWIFAAAVLTVLSLPVWLYRIGWKPSRLRFVRRLLKVNGAVNVKQEAKLTKFFTEELLKHDFVFIFKMMQLNAGDVITGEVMAELWKLWREEEEKKEAVRMEKEKQLHV